jgi:hypothetical protein
MKTDLYTKALLTVIAVMLTVMACGRLTKPDLVVSAQATSSVLFAVGSQSTYHVYDAKSGYVTVFNSDGSFHHRVKLGN